MKYLSSNLHVAILVFLCLPMFGQKNLDFPKDINLIKMTDPGVAIVGTDDALYGVNSEGTILWKNEKLKKVEAERVEILPGSELVFVSDKGLLARNRALNVLDGREYANSGTKGENIFGARVIHGTNQLWVMTGPKEVDVWDIDNNQKLYSLKPHNNREIASAKSASLTATFAGMQPITYTESKNAILHLALGHLGRYDLKSGKAQWLFDFKPYKLKGDKGDVASNPGDGFSVMKVDTETGTLYFPLRDMLIAIDMKTGASRWDVKANKTGKVRDMYIIDEGVLVLTYNGLQLIDNGSGNEIWDKPIKIKGADEGLLINDNGTFYMVSKNSVVKIDLENKRAETLTDKVKFQGGDSFKNIEAFESTIVLSGSQNLVSIEKKSGKIINSIYYKKPGPGLVTVAQNMALAAVAFTSTMNSYNINKMRAMTPISSTPPG